MEKPKYQIIAVISGMLTLLAISSLVITAHITKETEHLTFTWIVLVLSAQGLLFIYGFINILFSDTKNK